MGCSHDALRISLCFTAACLAVTFGWVIYSIPKLGPEIKSQFNLNQNNLELVYSMCFCGIMGSLVTGPFLQKLGIRWGSVFLSILTVPIYLLIGDSFNHIAWYKEHFGLFAFYWFLAGTCSASILVLATKACVQNFSRHHTATVNGVLTIAMSVGPFVVNLIWDYALCDDIPMFFVCMCVLNAVLNLFCALAYGKFFEDEEVAPLITETNNEKNYGTVFDDGIPETEEVDFAGDSDGMSLCDTVKCWYFWVFIFMCFVIQGSDISTIINVTIFSESLGLNEYTFYLPYMNSVLGFILKPLIGWISDVTANYVPHIAYIIISAFLNVIAIILAIFFLNNPGVFFLHQFICNVSFFFVSNNLPTLLNQEFGEANMTRNYSFGLCAWGLGCFVLQALFGYIYHIHVEENDIANMTTVMSSPYTSVYSTNTPLYSIASLNHSENIGFTNSRDHFNGSTAFINLTTTTPNTPEELTVCYGLECFAWTHIVTIILHLISIVTLLAYVRFHWYPKTRLRFYMPISETEGDDSIINAGDESKTSLLNGVKSPNVSGRRSGKGSPTSMNSSRTSGRVFTCPSPMPF